MQTKTPRTPIVSPARKNRTRNQRIQPHIHVATTAAQCIQSKQQPDIRDTRVTTREQVHGERIPRMQKDSERAQRRTQHIHKLLQGDDVREARIQLGQHTPIHAADLLEHKSQHMQLLQIQELLAAAYVCKCVFLLVK